LAEDSVKYDGIGPSSDQTLTCHWYDSRSSSRCQPDSSWLQLQGCLVAKEPTNAFRGVLGTTNLATTSQTPQKNMTEDNPFYCTAF